MPTAITDTSSTTANLRRLLVLRVIALLGQSLAILVALFKLHLDLPWRPLLVIIVGMSAVVIYTAWRLRAPRVVTEFELFMQLLVDVAALTALLYYTGGSTNPFVFLYLLPLTLTAFALPGIFTWLMAAITIVCYSLLRSIYLPLPHAPSLHGSDFDLHVFGMWLGFVLSAVLIAYFGVKMGESLRARDHALADLREDLLRHERILALGTLAAGTAHELGTPLSTLAVVIKDWETEVAEPETQARLSLLRTQVERCKTILATLSASAGEPRAEAGSAKHLDSYLTELLADWQAMRPHVRVRSTWQGLQPAPRLVTEQTLSQAIMNILNNAADASPQQVEVHAAWNHNTLALEVRDRGQGLSPVAAAKAGELFFTTKPRGQGLGLGLYLAHATLARLGGSVQLFNQAGGGVCTRLTLPLTALSVEA